MWESSLSVSVAIRVILAAEVLFSNAGINSGAHPSIVSGSLPALPPGDRSQLSGCFNNVIDDLPPFEPPLLFDKARPWLWRVPRLGIIRRMAKKRNGFVVSSSLISLRLIRAAIKIRLADSNCDSRISDAIW